MKLPKDLRGDGRRCISPRLGTGNLVPDTCHSMKLTMSQARRVVREFQQRGYTNHSPQGGTVWVVVEWCELNGHKCEVTTHRADDGSIIGYFIQIVEWAAA